MLEEVILVDENNEYLGTAEKMQAHEDGLLHRAFSIFIFNNKAELLLQQRADEKYHWGGAWANTCCSHPRPEENYEQATHRRLQEELGFDCRLVKDTSFVYKAQFDNGLIEHEHDTIFVGRYDGIVIPNSTEVKDYKWISISDVKKDIDKNSDKYAPWFKIILEKV